MSADADTLIAQARELAAEYEGPGPFQSDRSRHLSLLTTLADLLADAEAQRDSYELALSWLADGYEDGRPMRAPRMRVIARAALAAGTPTEAAR